jgi:hypothetical protein
MAQTITYQQLYDKLKAEGAFNAAFAQAITISGTVTIDLKQYQDAVLKLDFKEFTDTTFTSEITSTATEPSVEDIMHITRRKVNKYVPDADGGSIMMNGDRIVINAKSDYAMLFGQKGVAIASPSRVNFDAGESITLFGHGNQGVFIGLPNRGLQIPKTIASQTALGTTKGDPTPDYSYEPMVLGVKLANLLEDILFVLQNADMASSLSEAKWQPSTVAEFALLANRIPEILSTYAYVDGISHESVDEERLQKLVEQQKKAAPYVPPTSITATVEGTISPPMTGGSPYSPPNPSASPIGQNVTVAGGGGFALGESSKNFINKYCGGVAPVTLYADGTAVVTDIQNSGTRFILKPNPSYQAALANIKMPFKDSPGGKGLAVHPDFAAKLAPAFAEIATNGGAEYIEAFAGSYYPRNVTGGTRLSHHSYGFAFDINTNRGGTFGYGVHWNIEKQTVGGRPWTDWERGFYEKVATVMVKHGITWLYRGDPMHFSIYE